jgi:hypothetical protein
MIIRLAGLLLALLTWQCTGGGGSDDGDAGPGAGGACSVGGRVTLEAADEAALAAVVGALGTRRVFAVRDGEQVHVRIQLTNGTAALEVTVNIPLDATAGGMAVRQGEDEDEVHALATTKMRGTSGVDSDVLRDVHETVLSWLPSPLTVGSTIAGDFDVYLKTDCGRRIDHLRVRGRFEGEILDALGAFSLIEPCVLPIGNIGQGEQIAGRLELAVDGAPVVVEGATTHASYVVDRDTLVMDLTGPIGESYEVQVSEVAPGANRAALVQWIHNGCHYFANDLGTVTVDGALGEEAGTTGRLDIEVPLADGQVVSEQCPATRTLTGSFTLAVCTWYLGDDP